jgi:hypothetical protein
VRPRTYLHSPDEIGVDIGLFEQVQRQALQVVSDEVWFGASGGVQ